MSQAFCLPLLLLGVLLLFPSCERDDLLLLGSWRAVSVEQAGDSLRLNPAEIAFTFRPDNRYLYESTLKYREAGTWRYEAGFLFARDTTSKPESERIVAVELLTVDSLQLLMRADTVKRRVLLLKE
ncbi:MAG: hypothetical protein AAGF89_15650 [Bacteroidota bacterium]